MQAFDPFRWLTSSSQRRVLGALIVLSLSVWGVLTVLDSPLRTSAAPYGIGSFELARTLPVTVSILESWDATAKTHAALSLGLDYLFLALYSLSIALACTRIATGLLPWGAPFAGAGIALAWAQFMAAGLDAVENYALIQLLTGSREPSWPTLAWACAVPKFAIVAAGLAYVLIGGISLAFRGQRESAG